MTNEEIKPIEEIKNSDEEPKAEQAKPKAPLQAPEKPQAEDKTATTQSAPPPPPPPGSAGKKAIIKRPRSPILNTVLSILAVLIVLGAGFYFFFYRVTFEINPDPRPDKITIDGQNVEPGVFKTMPGEHTVVIEKKGYVSYIEKRNFKIAEKVNLGFTFEKEKLPLLSIPGARLPVISDNQELMFFLDQNSAISALKLSEENAKPSQLSNSQYPTTRLLKISKDNSFALLLDNEAIKIIDFSKTDLVNQVETKLPPLSSGIHTVTWNDNESQFFPKANSRIIYDLLSSIGWDSYLANLSHTEANLIMQLDDAFTNPVFDWGQHPNKVLIAGGQLGILDISSREYRKVESDKKFVFAKWSINGKYALAIDSEGTLYRITSDNKLEAEPFKVTNNLISFIDENTLAAVSEGKPLKYNLENKSLDYFAEFKDLATANSFVALSNIYYFGTSNGIFSGKFEKPVYK